MAGQGHGSEGLGGPADGPGREAEPLGGLHQAQEIGAVPVGAGQVAHLRQREADAVVQGEGGQCRGPAVALVILADVGIASQHGTSILSLGPEDHRSQSSACVVAA